MATRPLTEAPLGGYLACSSPLPLFGRDFQDVLPVAAASQAPQGVRPTPSVRSSSQYSMDNLDVGGALTFDLETPELEIRGPDGHEIQSV